MLTYRFRIWIKFFIFLNCTFGGDSYSKESHSNFSNPAVQNARPEDPLNSHFSYQYQSVVYAGFEYSNMEWLENYLRLPSAGRITTDEMKQLREKLLSTGVFSEITVNHDENRQALVITAQEKWTLIPVFRGSYGGGTPLTVLGIYDIHSFGKLLTLGAQFQRYGNLTPGGVVWLRAPRARNGDYSYGLELWEVNRKRNVFFEDAGKQEEKFILSKNRRVRGFYLWPGYRLLPWSMSDNNPFTGSPLNSIKPYPVQIGLELNMFVGRRSSIESENNTISRLNGKSIVSLGVKSVYDDILRYNTDMDGLRMVGDFAAVRDSDLESNFGSMLGLEMFYYKLMSSWNFASHLKFQNWNVSSHPDFFEYLGGFDSVRGYPDGVIATNRAIYGNFEFRYIGLKFSSLWLQQVAFFDWGKDLAPNRNRNRQVIGGDGNSPDSLASYGFGLRFILPKIVRFNVRVDWAKSLVEPRTNGFSIGLNQFFQPYKPL